jgi:protocatechuate 3,4-dioxygenase beta subunit
VMKDVVEPATVSVALVPEALISGQVTTGGAPVAGAQMLVSRVTDRRFNPWTQLETDAAGRFSVEALPPGSYHLAAWRGPLTGDSGANITVTVAQRAEAAITLSRGLAIGGVVHDQAGSAVPGARLVAIANGQFEGGETRIRPAAERSDEQGHFRIEGLPPGRYLVWVEAPGFSHFDREITVSADAPLDVEVARAPLVTGVVVGSDGQPVPGAIVAAATRMGTNRSDSDRAVTDASGRYRLSGLRPGRFDLVARSSQEVTQRRGVALGAGQTLELPLALSPGARVSGQVRDGAGRPVARIAVQGDCRAHPVYYHIETRADAEGRFEMGPFLPGRASIIALAADNNISWSSIARPEQSDVNLADGEWHKDVALVVSAAQGGLSGLVTTPEGAPLADARILVDAIEPGHPPRKNEAYGAVVATGPDGRFRIDGLRATRYAVWAVHPAYADGHASDVATGTRDLRLAVGTAARLTGVVVDPRGAPLTEYELMVAPAGPRDESEVDATTRRMNRETPLLTVRSASGAFSVDRLAAGRYELMVASPGTGLVAALPAVEVKAGEARRVRLRARPGIVVRGRAEQVGTGRPLPEAEIAVLALDGYRRAHPAADGRFEVRGLPARRSFQMTVASEGHGTRFLERGPDPSGVIELGTVQLQPGGASALDCASSCRTSPRP